MILAFVPFLVGGILWLVFHALGLFQFPHRPFQICLMMAAVSAVLGMVIRGVLIIYGTWNNLVYSYDVLAGLFFLLAVFCFVFYLRASGRRMKRTEGESRAK